MLNVLSSFDEIPFIFAFPYKSLNHKHILSSKMKFVMMTKMSVFTSKGTPRITGINISDLIKPGSSSAVCYETHLNPTNVFLASYCLTEHQIQRCTSVQRVLSR